MRVLIHSISFDVCAKMVEFIKVKSALLFLFLFIKIVVVVVVVGVAAF